MARGDGTRRTRAARAPTSASASPASPARGRRSGKPAGLVYVGHRLAERRPGGPPRRRPRAARATAPHAVRTALRLLGESCGEPAPRRDRQLSPRPRTMPLSSRRPAATVGRTSVRCQLRPPRPPRRSTGPSHSTAHGVSALTTTPESRTHRAHHRGQRAAHSRRQRE